MKRHFLTGLKALAVSALAFAAVSCYDDSELWGELEGLEQRVAALEQKLNTEVATLNSKLGAVEAAYKKADEAFNIADENVAAALKALTEELDALDGTVDGYVTSNDAALKKAIEDLMKADKENADAYKALADMDADLLAALAKLGVVSVEKKEDGSVVLTFADKSTVTVGAPVKNADNTGLVTIVDGEWAVIDEDGVVKKLGVPVDPETELFFRVKDNVLEISYDGKKTWVSTGVEVNDETSLNIVTDVQYTEGDAYVTVVVGENKYVLPFYQADNSELTLGRKDAFFMYGATKDIKLKAEGVKEYYVMSKPDGWKASLENNVLTVTAPAKELVELGAGELKGEVLVHATADNGTCKVASFKVTTGEAFSLTYDNGNVTVFNALTSEVDDENGDKMKEFYYVYLGIADEDYYRTFETSKEFYENAIRDFETINPFRLPAAGDSYYVEGVREEQKLTLTLDQVASALDLTLKEETNYVLFAIPAPQKPMYEEGKVAFTSNFIDVSFANSVYNNVDITISAEGVDSYIVGAANKTAIDQMAEQYASMGYDFKMYLEMGNGAGGPWTYFQYGMPQAMGIVLSGDENQVKLSDVVISSDGFTFGVDGETEYYVWVLPYSEERKPTDYSISELYVTTCKTADLTYNSDLAATVVTEPEYYKVNYTITSPEGASTYYYLYAKSYYDNLPTDYDFVGDLKMKCEQPSVGTETLSETYDINPGKEYVLVTYTVAGAEYGDVKTYFVSTPQPTYNNDIVVTLESITLDKAIFNVTGASHIYGAQAKYTSTNDVNYVKYILQQTSPKNHKAVENGKIEVALEDNPTYKPDYIVWAYNMVDGVVNNLQAKPLVINLAGCRLVNEVANAQSGATITLTANASLSSALVIDKDLTIDLNGKTLSSVRELPEEASSAVVLVSGGDVTIKNGTIATAGTANHQQMGAVWVYGENSANVTIENATLKGNNWNETKEGQTNCVATVYVSNPNGYVTINSGKFYCVKQTQVEAQNQILNYTNSFTTKNIVVTGGTFYGMDPSKGNGAEVSYVAEGYEATETAEGVYTVAMRTPDKKQWVFESAVLDNMAYDGEEVTAPLEHVLDLGVAYTPENYEYFEEATWVLATNFKDVWGEEEDYWLGDFNGETLYTITSTNLSSGIITLNIRGIELDIPYTEFTGTTCKFDLSALFNAFELEGESVVTAQVSTENIEIPFL